MTQKPPPDHDDASDDLELEQHVRDHLVPYLRKKYKLPPEEAKDLAWEAVGRAWIKEQDGVRAEGDETAWLIGVARNIVREQRKKRYIAARRRGPERDFAAPAVDPIRSLDRQDLLELVGAAVSQLSEGTQPAVLAMLQEILPEGERVTGEGLAKAMGIRDVRTAKRQFYRGIHQLRVLVAASQAVRECSDEHTSALRSEVDVALSDRRARRKIVLTRKQASAIKVHALGGPEQAPCPACKPVFDRVDGTLRDALGLALISLSAAGTVGAAMSYRTAAVKGSVVAVGAAGIAAAVLLLPHRSPDTARGTEVDTTPPVSPTKAAPAPAASGPGATSAVASNTTSESTATPPATTKTAAPPASRSSVTTTASLDLASSWKLDITRDGTPGPDTYKAGMVRLDQRLCPTTNPCFGGDGAHPWWHGDHYETNNIVLTPTRSGQNVALTAVEVTSGCTAHYDGTAPDVEPLVFSGAYHCDKPDGTREQTGSFTLTRE